MANHTQFIDHFNGVGTALSIALLSLTHKIIQNIHHTNPSISDMGTLASTLQKLVSCYADLQPYTKSQNTESGRLVSREVIDSIQTQLNLL
jgi:hypothetical protein